LDTLSINYSILAELVLANRSQWIYH